MSGLVGHHDKLENRKRAIIQEISLSGAHSNVRTNEPHSGLPRHASTAFEM